jgi:hypothetical protein
MLWSTACLQRGPTRRVVLQFSLVSVISPEGQTGLTWEPSDKAKLVHISDSSRQKDTFLTLSGPFHD